MAIEKNTRKGTRAGPRREPWSLLGDMDLHLFNEGRHDRVYQVLGAHLHHHGGEDGTYFAVWAPDAQSVAVVGDFNGWDHRESPMAAVGGSGIWEAFLPGIGEGERYKFHIRSRHGGYTVDKADPYGFHHEEPPATASVVTGMDYEWGDGEWLARRSGQDLQHEPMSVYEVHLGSWRMGGELGYREIADPLIEHVQRMGFTHVEFLPLMEHPFYGSWGYQVTGFFAPTARYGGPRDLMYLIDRLHQAGIGVILDWVPSHFPSDEHGLGYFDGTHLYEHADPRQGIHPDWGTLIFNYGRREVVSFLLSSARFWLDRYHVDGLRVDAVASMLYLDYSRKAGEWLPNELGGRENLEAVQFLRQLNETLYRDFPDISTTAEESTAWPSVSRPTTMGGLGFGMKWDMGWMHDTLRYLERDPVHRRHHHGELTFRSLYAWNENFVLPLSHDEVVHGKGSLLNKMPGDEWRKFANLRVLYAWMFATPGKKLLFMGAELAPWTEWNHDASLPWELLQLREHEGVRSLVADLNRAYRELPALHALDFEPEGFEWVDVENAEQSVLIMLRKGRHGERLLAIFNLTPVPRNNYRVGVAEEGVWREVLNTDSIEYGGSGQGNLGRVEAAPVPWHGRIHSLNLRLPPLSAVFLVPEDGRSR